MHLFPRTKKPSALIFRDQFVVLSRQILFYRWPLVWGSGYILTLGNINRRARCLRSAVVFSPGWCFFTGRHCEPVSSNLSNLQTCCSHSPHKERTVHARVHACYTWGETQHFAGGGRGDIENYFLLLLYFPAGTCTSKYEKLRRFDVAKVT